MKEIFPGYCKKIEEEIKNIWDKGLITFDANVLLDFYRFSQKSKEDFINLIKKFSSKIFLTHQAALEFHRHRFEVINEQAKVYKEFSDRLENLSVDLNAKNKPPFLDIAVQKKLDTILKEVQDELYDSEKKYELLLNKDEIYEEIENLFNSKIEKEYSQEELKKIYTLGKTRYEDKIPPGYEDKKKEGTKIYGDLILWKQIIDKAKKNKQPVILVTNDEKKDWWWKLKNGKIMGPRQELIEEIHKEANVEFHMYSTEKFLEFGLLYLNEESNPKLLAEVKEMKDYSHKTHWLGRDETEKTILRSILHRFPSGREASRIKLMVEEQLPYDIDEVIECLNRVIKFGGSDKKYLNVNDKIDAIFYIGQLTEYEKIKDA